MKRMLMVVLTVMIGLLQYRLWSGEGSLLEVGRLSKTIAEERVGTEKLVQRNLALEREIDALKHHPELLEERARAELGMIKQGETFCLVVEPAR